MEKDNAIKGGSGIGFLKLYQETEIKSNSTSLLIYIEAIVDTLEAIGGEDLGVFSQLTKQSINALKHISSDKGNKLDQKIIEPLIGISIMLHVLFNTPTPDQELLIQRNKEEFRKVLLNVLDITKIVKDTRIKDPILSASDAFIEKYK